MRHDAVHERLPAWFTPFRMLCVLTSMSVLVNLDRGLLASTPVNGRNPSPPLQGYGIKGEFNISDFFDGLLPSAFMVGLLVSSPVFVQLSKSMEPFRLVAFGLATSAVAIACCALAWSFWSLLAFRMVVGVGEASFVILAAPFIDAYAPRRLKGLWIAIFMMSLPVGYALGYIYGATVGPHVGWRGAFLSEALLFLPLVAFMCTVPPVPLTQTRRAHVTGALLETAGSGNSLHSRGSSIDELLNTPRPMELVEFEPKDSLLRDVIHLLKLPVYVLAVLGNAPQAGILGLYAYWGPGAVTDMFGLHDGQAEILLGAITVAAGILGTFLGGVLTDAFGGGARAAAALCLFAVTTGFSLLQMTLTTAYRLSVFAAGIGMGELAVFMLNAPMTQLILQGVPSELHPMAFSLQVATVHLLGDVPSPPAAGWIFDNFFSKGADSLRWRQTITLSNCLLLLSAAFFILCIVLISLRPEETESRRALFQFEPGVQEGIHTHRESTALLPSVPEVDDSDPDE